MLNTSKITQDLDSPYKKTYRNIQKSIGKAIETYRNQQETGLNLLLEGNRPKITMESDSPYKKPIEIYRNQQENIYKYIEINRKQVLTCYWKGIGLK